MKKFLVFLASALALIACNKNETTPVQPETEPSKPATLQVDVTPLGGPISKAVESYTDAKDYEAQVNKVEVFVFDATTGKIQFYKDLGASQSGNIQTTTGQKTVCAVVNSTEDLSSVGTLTELKAKAVDLGANSRTASKGFLMIGESPCDVKEATGATCSVKVSRLAARVALKRITNNLPASYGNITIDRVFLSNVVGNQNLGGNAAAATWYNQQGRMDEKPQVKEHIINGTAYKASCEEMTYQTSGVSIANGQSSDFGGNPYLLYCYANKEQTAGPGWAETFAPQRTVLTIVATVDGQTVYYPVVLKTGTIENNTTHTVEVTITQVGTDEPNKPIDKGGMDITITVDGWKAGANYEEII